MTDQERYVLLVRSQLDLWNVHLTEAAEGVYGGTGHAELKRLRAAADLKALIAQIRIAVHSVEVAHAAQWLEQKLRVDELLRDAHRRWSRWVSESR